MTFSHAVPFPFDHADLPFPILLCPLYFDQAIEKVRARLGRRGVLTFMASVYQYFSPREHAAASARRAAESVTLSFG